MEPRTVRALRADDASMLQAFVRRLSARSRRLRFFSALIEVSAAQLERLVNLDHRRGLAVVALGARAPQPIIAEARWVPDPCAPSAEFAIAVADEFQRRGLGTRLLSTLFAYASTGVRRLFGEILAENDPMLAPARRLGCRIEPNPCDRTTLLASIAPQLGDGASAAERRSHRHRLILGNRGIGPWRDAEHYVPFVPGRIIDRSRSPGAPIQVVRRRKGRLPGARRRPCRTGTSTQPTNEE